MKLEYKKRIYWLLRFILIICVINVLTGFYEFCTSSKNANANQIIWKGERYNKTETGYHSIDELKYLVDIPTDCDVKDIWAVASYYAKDDSECDTRLKELKNIYDEGGEKAVVEDIMSKDVGDDKKTMMEYLIVDGCLIRSLGNDTELLNNVLEHCYDRDYGFLGYKRYIDIGNKLYKKNGKIERIIEAFETLSKYTIDRAIVMPKSEDGDESATETVYYHRMIQLFQTFSSLSYFDDNLLAAKSYTGKDNKKYVVKAAITKHYDIILSYKKYKSFIGLGHISIYGRYKNLNMVIEDVKIRNLNYDDVFKYLYDKDPTGNIVADNLISLECLSIVFRLCGTYTLVYDTDVHTLEGISYGFYPVLPVYSYFDIYNLVASPDSHYIDTIEAIKNFNTNFSKGGYFGEFADDVGYDENNPVTLENFGERIEELCDMGEKICRVLYIGYNSGIGSIVNDFTGREPLHKKD
jgi:hypothetical protein